MGAEDKKSSRACWGVQKDIEKLMDREKEGKRESKM